MGHTPEMIAQSKQKRMATCWNRFDALSTREQRGSAFVTSLTGKPCATVLDPTLLLAANDYNRLSLSSSLPSEYIFYYTPREEPGTFLKAQELARQTGLKILVTQDSSEYTGTNVIRINDCGPREFINIIRGASYCIGNSFHLLAFSLISIVSSLCSHIKRIAVCSTSSSPSVYRTDWLIQMQSCLS